MILYGLQSLMHQRAEDINTENGVTLHTPTYVLTLLPYKLHFVIHNVQGRVPNTSLYINRWIHVQKLYSLNHNKIVIYFEFKNLLYMYF